MSTVKPSCSVSAIATCVLATTTLLVFIIIAAPHVVEAACSPNQIAVAAFAKHLEKRIVAAAKVDPACNMVEIGLLGGADSVNLVPIGQTGNSTSGTLQQEMAAQDAGTYWVAAYVRDEEGTVVQSAAFPVHVMESPEAVAQTATALATATTSYTGTDTDFLQVSNNNHLASVKSAITQTNIELTFFETLMIDSGSRFVANTSRNSVLSQQLQPIPTRSTTVNFDSAQIQDALNRDEFFFSNYPRSGLYEVRCEYELFPSLNSGCSELPTDLSLVDTDILQVFTPTGSSPAVTKQVERSSVVYFIPPTPPGKRFKEAKFRALFNASGEQAASIAPSILINGKPPSDAQIFSCNSGAFGFQQLLNCQGFATWDLTGDVNSLVSGGGQLTVSAQLSSQFSGTLTTPDAVNNLTYKALGISALVNYPWLQRGENGSLAIVFEDTCTGELQVTLNPDTVNPSGPQLGGLNNQSTVEVNVNGCPQPGASSVAVSLQIDPDRPTPGSSDSGGHNHGGARPRGSFDGPNGPTTALCNATLDADGHGRCSVNYFSSQVAGNETIVARATNFPDTEKKMIVQVPGLANLAGININFLRLTGQLPQHPDNHWGTTNILNNTQLVALDYFAGFGATLGINDMSLQQGGLFDISGSWQTPHLAHRKGTSVDIDGTACLDPNLSGGCSAGTIRVDKQFIGRRCLERGRGFLVPEVPIHCEFPN